MTSPTPSFYTTHFTPPVSNQPKRAFIVVIDALGVGAMSDAPDYGDALTANTLGNIDANVDTLNLPSLEKLGLGNILPLQHVSADANAIGSWGKLAEKSIGKDTTTGHWEMMGITLETPFPTYPNGFPYELVQAFIAQTGCQGILGNKPASGTKILDELGEEHLKTGFPIVYTSADSVWQIKALSLLLKHQAKK
jgi:phosphopentomutase